MSSIKRLSCVVVSVAFMGLFSSAAWGAAKVGSGDTATADPNVERPHETPCVATLYDSYTFADFSPKTFAFTPPDHCAGPFAKVVLEADFAVSAGRQYDRTATIFIGGANVYFGTTMEPSKSLGPTWHVERDLTDYAALFAGPQAGRVEIGNLVDGTYTGVISGSARLYFYPAGRHVPAATAADAVLPLSASPTGGTVALASTSSRLAQSFSLPKNIERAYLDVFAQSQSQDEFSYTCVPSDVADQVQSCGGTSFREVEITIDGQPAGVAPIYPWIFTGGIDPYLWRPIPGLQTLNFLPYRVDLSPFAGLLSNGKSHEVALSVYNANNYFAATATLLLYLDHDATQVFGAVTANSLSSTPAASVKEALTTAMDGSVQGTVTVGVTRHFAISGYVQTSHGRVVTEVAQDVRFKNQQTFLINATNYQQKIDQLTTVASIVRRSEHGQQQESAQDLSWPLQLDYSFITNADKTSAQTTTVRQGYRQHLAQRWDGLPIYVREVSNSVAPTDTLIFDATGTLTGTQDQNSEQRYFSADSSGACYSRAIRAEKGLVTQILDGAECGP